MCNTVFPILSWYCWCFYLTLFTFRSITFLVHRCSSCLLILITHNKCFRSTSFHLSLWLLSHIALAFCSPLLPLHRLYCTVHSMQFSIFIEHSSTIFITASFLHLASTNHTMNRIKQQCCWLTKWLLHEITNDSLDAYVQPFSATLFCVSEHKQNSFTVNISRNNVPMNTQTHTTTTTTNVRFN